MTSVSIIVATRDRPHDLARCLPSLLASNHPDFEVVLVDQSTTDATQKVVQTFLSPQLRYIRLSSSGKGRALNAALAQAKGTVLALTDDDCTVPEDWLRRGEAALAADRRIAVVFGSVVAAPHDAREDFVPVFLPKRRRRLEGRPGRLRCTGLGANMFIRRRVAELEGGFDECLGPGGTFRGGIDVDFAHRAMRLGFAVVQDPENPVVHWGFRNYADGSARRLLRNNYYGIGARLIKQVRCGDPLAAYTLARVAAREVIAVVLNILRLRGVAGAARLRYLALGAWHGLRQPLDRDRWLYQPEQEILPSEA